MALLYFQPKAYSDRVTASCPHGMDGGNNVLVAGRSFWGRLLPSGRSEYTAESKYASKSSNQPY